ncbi:hypothetical protein Tco_0267897 [Tanacetum coccineum]
MSVSPERTSVFSRIRRDRSESPRQRPGEKGRRDRGVFNRLGDKGNSVSADSESRYQSYRSERTESIPRKRHHERTCSPRPEVLSESEDSGGGHWKSKSKKQRSSIEDDDLSQPWICEEIDPFTSRIRYFELPKKTRMPNNVKTYDESDDPEDHLKIFQIAAKVEWWAMRTWCHMFNSTLTGSARKCIKDPVEIHHIKQSEGESTEYFVQRFKAESRHVKGAPECMRISVFMHGITNPELIKRLHDNIPKSVDEMMRVTTTFLRGEVAASNQARKKAPPAWKQQEAGRKQNFDRRGDLRNQQRSERRRDKFTLLNKSPKEILALDKGKFKTPPPMTTPVEKRNSNKFCEFHGEVGHNTDECMHLKRQIKEMIKAGMLSHLIKEKVARQRITQSFSPDREISFPPLGDEDGTKGLMIIEAKIGGHFIHRMYVDGGSSLEILYEHCFNRLRPEVKKPNGSGYHTPYWLQWRDYMANGTNIAASKNRRCRTFDLYIDEFRGGKITISVQRDHRKARSSKIIPLECTMVSGPDAQSSDIFQTAKERIKVAIHPEYPEQTITIGSTLTEEGRKALCDLLRRNLDIFAWKPADMTGPRDILLLQNAFWPKECRSNLPVPGRQSIPGRNLEVYVDDLVIKSCTEHEIMRDTEETFKTLREINMKLNPKKCTFGIEEGMFLGYKVNTKGIKLIAELPTLTAPMEKEELIVYLAAVREVVHTIIVITDQPIKHVLSRPEVAGRLQKWSIELGEYDIQYRPRTLVKGQILADFIVERPEDDPLDTPMEAEEELPDLWTLFTDRSSCVDSSGAGLILTNPEGAEFTYDLRFRFDATNNEAEYEALIADLRITE